MLGINSQTAECKNLRKMTFEKGSGNVFTDIGFANPGREPLMAHLTLQIYCIINSAVAILL
jgi:hypothetical protein